MTAFCVGCGAGATAQQQASTLPLQQTASSAVAEAAVNEQLSTQVRELEAQLALAQSESRDLRHELEVAHERLRSGESRWQVTRILHGASENLDQTAAAEEAEQNARPRRVLRLIGSPAVAERFDTSNAAPDARLFEPLPVVPLVDPVGGVAGPAPAQRQDPRTSAEVVAYQEALRTLATRDYARAETLLTGFIVASPGHSYVPSAYFWRAEARYARQAYTDALTDFAAVVRGYPDSPRAALAFYKTGLCELRLGRVDDAKRIFRQVSERYPNSLAARMAAEELP